MGTKTLYHYSDPSNRDSIAEKGLLIRHPDGSSLAEDDGHQPGVYLFADKAQADMLDGDTYEVDAYGLDLHPDPFHDDQPGTAWVSHRPIPPDKITFSPR